MVSYRKTRLEKLSDEQFEELLLLYDDIFPDIIEKHRSREKNTDIISTKKAKWIFAEDKKKIVGFITMERRYDHIFMFNFGVAKEYRNKGIGKKLFDMVTKQGMEKIEFYVDKDDEKLQKMYGKWGCKKIGIYSDKVDRFGRAADPHNCCVIC